MLLMFFWCHKFIIDRNEATADFHNEVLELWGNILRWLLELFLNGYSSVKFILIVTITSFLIEALYQTTNNEFEVLYAFHNVHVDFALDSFRIFHNIM